MAEKPKQPSADYPFSVRLPAEVRERLAAYAQEDERNLSGEVLWILRRYIAHRERKAREHEPHLFP